MTIHLIDPTADDEIARVAEVMRRRARRGTFDGRMTREARDYFDNCREYHGPSGTMLIFSRDTGHHTSGWFKNPDYERCLHLSLSFRDQSTQLPAPYNHRLAGRWARAFFADAIRLAWGEPPVTPEGKSLEVWHWRVFCDEHWQPIHPRGEVYSTDFTEKGWQSASELREMTGAEVWSPLAP